MFSIHFFCKKDCYNEQMLISIKNSMELLRALDEQHFDCYADEPYSFEKYCRLLEVVFEDDYIFGECDFTTLQVFLNT